MEDGKYQVGKKSFWRKIPGNDKNFVLKILLCGYVSGDYWNTLMHKKDFLYFIGYNPCNFGFVAYNKKTFKNKSGLTTFEKFV